MSKLVAHPEAIRAIRERAGQSVSAFAPKVGVTQGYMSNVELGHKIPTVELLSRIAHELGVPLAAITYTPKPCEACGRGAEVAAS